MGVNDLLGSNMGQMEGKDPQTTDDGTKYRAKKDGRRKHTRGSAPVHGIPYVRDDTSAVGERCHGKEATEKAGDE